MQLEAFLCSREETLDDRAVWIDNWLRINPLHAVSIIQQVSEAQTGRQPNQVRTLITFLKATALFFWYRA